MRHLSIYSFQSDAFVQRTVKPRNIWWKWFKSQSITKDIKLFNYYLPMIFYIMYCMVPIVLEHSWETSWCLVTPSTPLIPRANVCTPEPDFINPVQFGVAVATNTDWDAILSCDWSQQWWRTVAKTVCKSSCPISEGNLDHSSLLLTSNPSVTKPRTYPKRPWSSLQPRKCSLWWTGSSCQLQPFLI